MNKPTQSLLIATLVLAGISAELRLAPRGVEAAATPPQLQPMNCGRCTPGSSDWQFADKTSAPQAVLQLSGAEIRGLSQLGLIGF
ncbi:MAG: hypothetical protein HWE39_22400 [Oceanospirillaceae bacterium]|nr:hypothetical protein [Oceanospirillaceae bacterium]